MKNPFNNYFTPTEQKTLLFLISFALIGFLVDFVNLKADDKNSEVIKIEEAVKDDEVLKIDIRTASEKEFSSLPGIGEKRAKTIVEFRESNPFLKTSDLKKIKGIGDKTFQKLLPNLVLFGEVDSLVVKNDEFRNSVDESNLEKINLNSATLDELMQLNGIGESKAKKIIELRKRLGKFEQIEQLTQIKGIGEKIVEKNRERIVLE